MNAARPFKWCFVIGICSFLAFSWLIHVMIGPAMPRSLLGQIRLGMTKSDVREILGEPNEVSSESEWEFSRLLNCGWVEIWFDDQGRVAEINDESVFP